MMQYAPLEAQSERHHTKVALLKEL